MTTLIEAHDLTKRFSLGKQEFYAIHKLNLCIYTGETLGLVGESGCGKSTVGRTLLRLYEPTGGRVLFKGIDLSTLSKREMKEQRRHMQMIFQDPYASLNPRMTVQDIIGEPLDIHRLATGEKRRQKVVDLLQRVGLSPSHSSRFPHEFSGGQRQRIGIARALALEPSFLVCDEPISALDVSIQAQIVNLLKHLQREIGLTYLFIAHDLAMVKYISHRIAVMYLGHLLELAPTPRLYSHPLHPYTKALLASIPIPDPTQQARPRHVVQGEIPGPLQAIPTGCPFASRCPLATALCREEAPRWQEIEEGHFTACHYVSP